MLTEPLAASARGIGPIVLLMISGPGGDDHWPVPDIQRIADHRAAGVDRALIEIARPRPEDLAIGDGQTHLVAVTEGAITLAIATRLVVGLGTQDCASAP